MESVGRCTLDLGFCNRAGHDRRHLDVESVGRCILDISHVGSVDIGLVDIGRDDLERFGFDIADHRGGDGREREGDPRVGRSLMNTYHADHPLLRYPIDQVFIPKDSTLQAMSRVRLFQLVREAAVAALEGKEP